MLDRIRFDDKGIIIHGHSLKSRSTLIKFMGLCLANVLATLLLENVKATIGMALLCSVMTAIVTFVLYAPNTVSYRVPTCIDFYKDYLEYDRAVRTTNPEVFVLEKFTVDYRNINSIHYYKSRGMYAIDGAILMRQKLVDRHNEPVAGEVINYSEDEGTAIAFYDEYAKDIDFAGKFESYCGKGVCLED